MWIARASVLRAGSVLFQHNSVNRGFLDQAMPLPVVRAGGGVGSRVQKMKGLSSCGAPEPEVSPFKSHLRRAGPPVGGTFLLGSPHRNERC